MQQNCWGKCGRSYRQCLVSRRVNLKKNGREMVTQMRRNLDAFFKRGDYSQQLSIDNNDNQ